MKKRCTQHILKSQKGIALLETIPLVVIFAMLLSFGLGLFGIIHTSILHSIGARAYNFEVFRQRANLYYFREDGSGLQASGSLNFSKKGWRYQAVNHESDARQKFVATVRPIALGGRVPAGDNTESTNNVAIYDMQTRNERFSVNPV